MSQVDLDLASATITAMSTALRQRDISPVELVTATLERIAALQPCLLCFTTVTPEYAMQRAREAERAIARGQYRGPLHGIPYTLKDVIATKGIRTTFGNPKGVDYRPQESATLHTLLEAAGGILVGKVVSEIGRRSTGPVGCRNPWDITRSPGTSSSGSGAAVAAALGLASVGTDTGGSVRHPASNSGLVGMKATFGRISRFGVWASSWSTDQAGPLTGTVEDNAMLLEILGVYDAKDPVSINQPAYDYCASLRDGIKGVRVGVPVDDWVWRDWLSEEEETVVRRAIDVLEALGASVTEVRLPRAAEARTILAALAPETPVYIDDHFTKEQIDPWPEHHSTIIRGQEQPFADYLHAQQALAYMRQEIVAVLHDVDVIAMPTGSTFGDTWDTETVIIRGRQVPARSRAVYRNGLASLVGHPAMSVPCGFGMGETLPIGLMLHGRPLEETLGVGSINGIFVSPRCERIPAEPPSISRLPLAAMLRPQQPRQSIPRLGTARQSAAWTCRIERVRIAPQGCPGACITKTCKRLLYARCSEALRSRPGEGGFKQPEAAVGKSRGGACSGQKA